MELHALLLDIPIVIIGIKILIMIIYSGGLEIAHHYILGVDKLRQYMEEYISVRESSR